MTNYFAELKFFAETDFHSWSRLRVISLEAIFLLIKIIITKGCCKLQTDELKMEIYCNANLQINIAINFILMTSLIYYSG